MLGACLRAGDVVPRVTQPAAAQPETLEEEALPRSPVSGVPSFILDAHLRSVHRWQMLAGCKVAPLLDITDPEALEFEKNAETAPADVNGLMPEASMALTILEQLVTSIGGRLALQSAYR